MASRRSVLLVKALEEIPFDGELVPSSLSFKLVKDKTCDFCKLIRFKVKEKLETKLQRKLDLLKTEDITLLEEAMQVYYPYVRENATYNLFTINGIHESDALKKIAVIDLFDEHIRSTFGNINITGTSINGPIRFSDSSILLIDETLYNSLSIEMKDNLVGDYCVKKFNASLKEALKKTLLSLNAPYIEIDNLESTPEVNMIKGHIDSIAKQKEVSTKRYEELLTSDPERSWIIDMLSAVNIQEADLEDKKVRNQYLQHLYLSLMEYAMKNGLALSVDEEYALHTLNYNAYSTLTKVLDFITTLDGGFERIKNIVAEHNKYARGTNPTNRTADYYILSRKNDN